MGSDRGSPLGCSTSLPLQLAAAAYLLLAGWSNLLGSSPASLSADKILRRNSAAQDRRAITDEPGAPGGPAIALGRCGCLTLAVHRLWLSLDSVAAAVAVTDRLWLVMLGG